MNPALHHMWNAVRDAQRGSDRETKKIAKEDIDRSQVTVKQGKRK